MAHDSKVADKDSKDASKEAAKEKEMPKEASSKDVKKEVAKEVAKETAIIMKCTSCGVSIEAEGSWVEFPCPKCRKQKIIRCDKCKKLMNTYECKKCGFIGP